MDHNFIPTNLKDLCKNNITVRNTKTVIHPFIKQFNNKLEITPIHALPKVFNKCVPINVEELCYRDTYMQDDGVKIVYYKQKRTPIIMNNIELVELIATKSVDKSCFPILKKYDEVKKYKRYEYSVNKSVSFVAIETNSKLFFQIEILNVEAQSNENLIKLNKFLNKNIAKYKISDD